MTDTKKPAAVVAERQPAEAPEVPAVSAAEFRPDRHAEKAEDLRLRDMNWMVGESHCLDDLPEWKQAELETDGRRGKPL